MGTIRINRVGLEATRVTRVSKSNLSNKGTKGCRLRIQSDKRPIIRRWLASDGFSEADSTQSGRTECDKYHSDDSIRVTRVTRKGMGQNTPEPMAEVDNINTGRTTPERGTEVVVWEREIDISNDSGIRMVPLVGGTEGLAAALFLSGKVRTKAGGSASVPEQVAEPAAFQAGGTERATPNWQAGHTAAEGEICVDSSGGEALYTDPVPAEPALIRASIGVFADHDVRSVTDHLQNTTLRMPMSEPVPQDDDNGASAICGALSSDCEPVQVAADFLICHAVSSNCGPVQVAAGPVPQDDDSCASAICGALSSDCEPVQVAADFGVAAARFVTLISTFYFHIYVCQLSDDAQSRQWDPGGSSL